MKKLIFIAFVGMSTLVFGSEALTVQVISAIHEKSVTKAFDAKVKETGMEVHKKIENNRFVVTVGSFDDHKSARKGEIIARQFVTKDAFVRPVERHTTVVAHKVVEHKTVEAKVVEPKVASAQVVTQHPAEHVAVQPTIVVPAVTTVAVVAPKSPDVKAAATPLSDCDKRSMHTDELAAAIRYYKTSPYHRFEPVELRR